MPKWPIYTGTIIVEDNSRVLKVLELLGNPHRTLRNVIHVAGTNGKGSVCAYIRHILNAAGKSCNVFTSPHLIACAERINMRGEDISDEKLTFYLERVRYICEGNGIEMTMFEALTIAAFSAFAEYPADFTIIEVGMGGLNDATNVFEAQNLAATILTSISFDHTKYLGDTLYLIASNKVFIGRAGVPFVIFPQKADSMRAVLDYSFKTGVDLLCMGRDYMVCKVEFEDADGSAMEYRFRQEEPVLLPLPALQGEHQLLNAAVAITALKEVSANGALNLTWEAIAEGLANTTWAGRLERVKKPHLLALLPEGSELWFDGAHNPDGARVLSEWLAARKREGFKIGVILGKTAGSDSTDFTAQFKDIADLGVSVETKGEIFPEKHAILQEAFKVAGIPSAAALNLTEAISALGQKLEGKTLIIICGSLYLARDVLWA